MSHKDETKDPPGAELNSEPENIKTPQPKDEDKYLIVAESYDKVMSSIADLKPFRQAADADEEQYFNQIDLWVKEVSPSDEDQWRIFLRELQSFKDKLIKKRSSYKKAVKTITFKQSETKSKLWSEFSSDEHDSQDEFTELNRHVNNSGFTAGIEIPEDLQDIFPVGFRAIQQTCELLDMPLTLSQQTLSKGGFKFSSLFNKDDKIAQEAYNKLDTQGRASINTFKALILFLKLQPNDVLISDSKFALPASYVLHFLIRKGDEVTDKRNFKCLKHSDGGRSLIESRLAACFSTNHMVGSNLLINLDKLYRSLAKRMHANGRVDNELRSLIIEHCFTSPEGMLNCFFTTERRKKNKNVTVVNAKGKSVIAKEQVIIDGKRVPTLSVGSDLITLKEKELLKEFENRFDLTQIVKNHTKNFKNKKIEDVAIFVEELVEDAYLLTSKISSVIKRRKNAVRAEASLSPDGKINPATWQAGLIKVLNGCEAIPESTFQSIEEFLIKYQR
jgi:hypothetical protein